MEQPQQPVDAGAPSPADTRPERLVAVLVDRSGSMSTTRADAEGGLAAFFAEQRKAAGRTRASLFQFDNVYEPVYTDVPAERVPFYQLHPRGGTALLDAIGKMITDVDEHLAALSLAGGRRPDQIVVVIVTDGHENASVEYRDVGAVRGLIESRRADGWQFVFLGATPDTFQVAYGLGIPHGSTLSYDSREGTRAAYTAAAGMTTRSSYGGQAVFTEDERAAAAGQSDSPRTPPP